MNDKYMLYSPSLLFYKAIAKLVAGLPGKSNKVKNKTYRKVVTINTISEELVQVCDEINEIEKIMQALPNGKLLCTHNNKYYKWFCSDETGVHYIPKKNLKYTQELAYKKYLTIKLKELKTKKNSLHATLMKQNIVNKEMTNLISNPAYLELLKPYNLFQTDHEWMNETYERNLKYPEQLIHESVYGLVMRSKSESLIGILLAQHDIPFRYEC